MFFIPSDLTNHCFVSAEKDSRVGRRSQEKQDNDDWGEDMLKHASAKPCSFVSIIALFVCWFVVHNTSLLRNRRDPGKESRLFLFSLPESPNTQAMVCKENMLKSNLFACEHSTFLCALSHICDRHLFVYFFISPSVVQAIAHTQCRIKFEKRHFHCELYQNRANAIFKFA